MTRTCPHCGHILAGDDLVCPHCQEPLDVTQRISLDNVLWCSECGALIPEGLDSCPKCGHETGRSRSRRRMAMNLPEIESAGEGESEDEPGEGEASDNLARIESAIPGNDPEASPGAIRDRMPRPRAFAFAALLALVVVGGTTLLITHPWDPQATQTKAKEPADTSMSGFPGFVESLSGQDHDREEAPDASSQSTLEVLSEAHEELGELSGQIDSSEGDLRDLIDGSGSVDAETGLERAEAISISVSNAIAGLEEGGFAGGSHDEDISNLKTLGSWLRNRCDSLTRAWELAEGASDLSSVEGSIDSLLDASRDYGRLFSESYDSWAPAESDE